MFDFFWGDAMSSEKLVVSNGVQSVDHETTTTSFYICRSKAKIAEIRYLRKQTEAVKEKDY